MAVRCLLVDDSRHFLEVASKLLVGQGLTVAGVASTSAEALTRVRELEPDVTIVDVDLNGESGFDLAWQLAATSDGAPTRTILTSTRSESDFAELVAVMRLEEAYHLDHARAWFERLAAGPVTARHRLAEGLETAVGEAVALFEPLPDEETLVDGGVLPRSNEALLADWLAAIGEDLEAVSLDYVLERHGRVGEMVPTGSGEVAPGEALSVPGLARREGRWVHDGGFAGAGGRHGRHSEDFLPLWEEMTTLYRAHPGARW